MNGIFLTIIVMTGCILVIFYAARSERLARRDRRRRAMMAPPPCAYGSGPAPAGDGAPDSDGSRDDNATCRLLGREVYDAMVARVDDVLDRHASHMSRTVALGAGPESEEGSRALHSLLPGDPLHLECAPCGGEECVEVYSAGLMVGRILPGDAGEIERILSTEHVTGAYVAEQNCWGDSDIVSLKVIVFYEPDAAAGDVIRRMARTAAYKITLPGRGAGRSFTIFQN